METRPALPPTFWCPGSASQLPPHLLVPRICPPSLIRSLSRGCRGGSGPGGGPASWWCRFLCFFLCFLCFFLWPPWPPASASCPVRGDTGSARDPRGPCPAGERPRRPPGSSEAPRPLTVTAGLHPAAPPGPAHPAAGDPIPGGPTSVRTRFRPASLPPFMRGGRRCCRHV